MQSRSFPARLLALAFLLIVTGGHAYARRAYSAMSENESFHNKSAVKLFRHEVRGHWNGARINVSMHLDAGGALVRLIDDSGATRWEHTFTGGEATLQQTLSGRGLWKVELRLTNATGRYSIKLTAV